MYSSGSEPGKQQTYIIGPGITPVHFVLANILCAVLHATSG